MGIQLEVSNSLQSLSDKLIEELRKADSVFRPIYIVTQTEGMNNWLKLQIADKTRIGIAANLRFVRPNDIVHKVFQFTGGTYAESISTHDLNWPIYQLLDTSNFKEKYPFIAAYYDQESMVGRDIKRMALAEKIADLYDQYQIYRSDMMDQWNKGQLYAEETGLRGGPLETFRSMEQWQQELWNQCKKLFGDKESFPDKNKIGRDILDNLNDKDKIQGLKNHLPEVYFFGISLITSYHLKIFHALSAYIDVHFLIQNPAPNSYWFEDKTEKVMDYLIRKGFAVPREESLANPLLVGWGKLIQNTFMMMFQNEDFLNAYREVNPVEPISDTLLHAIQQSIFNNEKQDVHLSKELQADGSITINSCYSPAREVEVLYNYLVQIVDKNGKGETLSARDILVSVTDIDLYASYIKAIFDNAPYRFNYTIADESYASSENIFTVLTDILSITENHFTSENIVSLLDSAIIRKRHHITDIEIIRRVVDAANIRFGIDGHREDESIYVSWQYGLRRIMYGLSMIGDGEYGSGENGFYPINEAEGEGIFEVTKFVGFVELLINSLKERVQKRTTAEWVEYIQTIIENFIGSKEDNDDEDYQLLSDQLGKYNLLDDLFKQPVSFEVFIHHFLPGLAQVRRSQNFASGGITFCSLIPMRSIPFKVVAMLGMNYEKFPRHAQQVSFDLIQQKKRKGDRDIKENDKHLFLETLLSAQEYLYISFIGQSIKDNSAIPPSALVDELLDFIKQHTDNTDAANELVVRQPLHSFSRKYNSDDSRLYSYLLQKKKEVIDWSGTDQKEAQDFSTLSIKKFAGYIIEPIKGYYNEILDIKYEERDDTLQETELFDLDRLQQWKFKDELLYQPEEDLESRRLREVKRGNLPLRNKGTLELEDMKDEIEIIRLAFEKIKGGNEEEEKNIQLQLDETSFSDKVGSVYGNKFIAVCLSKSLFKYQLKGYVNYLFLSATGCTLEPFLVNSDGNVFQGLKINSKEALKRLNQLFDIYIEGHDQIIPFHPKFNNLRPKKKVFDFNEFNYQVRKIVADEKHFFDLYTKKEFNNGMFNQEATFERFLGIEKIIINPVSDFWGEAQSIESMTF